MNDRYNQMNQSQPQMNSSLVSYSPLTNPIIDSGMDRIRNQNLFPMQDPQRYFNQEHQRLRERLIQEILKSRQPIVNDNQQQSKSSQFFHESKEHGKWSTTKDLLEARKAEEMAKTLDKQIREETNRVELLIKQKQREDNLRKLHQDLYGQPSTDSGSSQQLVTELETSTIPKQDASRRKVPSSFLKKKDKNDSKRLLIEDKNLRIPLPSHGKLETSKGYDANTLMPTIPKAGPSVDIVDLTDDADTEIENIVTVLDVVLPHPSSPVNEPVSPPIIAQIITKDEENKVQLSLLLEAIDMESLERSPQVWEETPTITVDNNELVKMDESLPYENIQKSYSYSKESVESILSTLKQNKELYKIESSEDINDMIPHLPSEPIWDSSVDSGDNLNEHMLLPIIKVYSAATVAEPTDIRVQPVIPTTDSNPAPPSETWWPKTAIASSERNFKIIPYNSKRWDGDVSLPHFVLSNERHEALTKDVEPGVIEKLPYCRLAAGKSSNPLEPTLHLYCVQVTTMFCTNPMLCCSECYTWRHAECGGHYAHTFLSSIIPSDQTKNLKPICDRCFTEQKLLVHYPDATKRLRKQRIDHLRREQMTSAVMNEVMNSSVFKQPIGNVSDGNRSSYVRNIEKRYEKVIKHWNDMVDVIGALPNTVKSKTDVNEREYNRLLKFFEDAGKLLQYSHNGSTFYVMFYYCFLKIIIIVYSS